ncbi:tetratricopeptide repeat protein [Clostridiales bacterium COT073_COT-073]|nr:tetratricopeptide repeat protein [Clostridiales bacterium COT073_COT-073]
MEVIKRKWFFISLAYIFAIYFIFIVMLKGGQPTLYIVLLSAYVCVTAILFIGNIVGFPGLVLHAFFKKEEKALPFYQAAYKLGSKSSQLLSAYGLVLLRKGEAAQAKEIFETALAHNRNYLYTRTLKANIAICDWKLGDPQKAYDEYLDLYYFPDKEKLVDYSLDNLEVGAELNPSFTEQDFLTMGFLALLINNIDAALYFSHLALLKSPNYAAAYDNLGQIYFKTGDKEKAKEAFDKALELKPTLIDSLYYLALLALENDQAAEAKEYAEKALAQPFNALNTISEHELNRLAKLVGIER